MDQTSRKKINSKRRVRACLLSLASQIKIKTVRNMNRIGKKKRKKLMTHRKKVKEGRIKMQWYRGIKTLIPKKEDL